MNGWETIIIKMPQMVVLAMDTNGRLQKEIIDGTKVMVTTATETIQNILSSSGSIIRLFIC